MDVNYVSTRIIVWKVKSAWDVSRMPCKVGDTVYHIVGRIILEVENVDLFFLLLSVAEGRFGETVFLAKEEAETMLKK